ncbi:MAG: peptidoglycan editing factor PgeF [Deltaproteobacteria bacterium]|nr:peptidoglycan editing factor PgeF [Deltaproteobacteria bacterium]MBW2079809.1 peptidoglycan editing factor PgeF [Deltaproteobacteria bacterium]MBW2349734.1 peptidoglycan editing factor PgeF [Deltaproteobacteria bacterium]
MNPEPVNSYIPMLQCLPDGQGDDLRCISFTRWGGVSLPPYNDLNIGLNVGDDRKAVEENRQIVRATLNARELISFEQVHGSRLAVVEGPVQEESLAGIDGLLTDVRGTALLIKHADCQAVVLYDPEKRAIANIHCGWKGSVSGVLIKAVRKMAKAYSSRPQNLWASVSPSLGPCCAEFKDWKSLLPRTLHDFQTASAHFDFWAITRWQLRSAGLPSEQIELSRICTACSDDYFSYRREGLTGRNATAIMLT